MLEELLPDWPDASLPVSKSSCRWHWQYKQSFQNNCIKHPLSLTSASWQPFNCRLILGGRASFPITWSLWLAGRQLSQCAGNTQRALRQHRTSALHWCIISVYGLSRRGYCAGEVNEQQRKKKIKIKNRKPPTKRHKKANQCHVH